MSRSIFPVENTFLICLPGQGGGVQVDRVQKEFQPLLSVKEKYSPPKKLALFRTTFSNMGSVMILETFSIIEDRFTNQHPTLCVFVVVFVCVCVSHPGSKGFPPVHLSTTTETVPIFQFSLM